ncbi:MAG: hypothetical protein K0Q90_530 [Paenibacillaceae bacterium]|jgi:two-component system response regulator YesN|nr:hypothetical protein [Paenibacillaceae bacterium]
MIRAAVVDDERLVRKGFMSMIDWAAFDVVMVGEAGDGREALKLVETEEIDLLFVDISMPVMSGFELIRRLRELHPHVHSVVLTCHHEFEYVQEALRLGAVDYIVKTLLDIEKADETISRIMARLKWEERFRSGGGKRGEGDRFSADKAIVYLSLEPDGGEERLYSLRTAARPLADYRNVWISSLHQGFRLEEARQEMREQLGAAWLTAVLSGVQGADIAEVAGACSARLGQTLFYHPEGHVPLVMLPYRELLTAAVLREQGEGDEALEQGADLAWTLGSAERTRFMELLSRQKPHYSLVLAFCRRLLQDWGPFLPDPEELTVLEAALPACRSLTMLKGWLRRFADLAAGRMLELGFTREVMQCMFRAVCRMRADLGRKLNQNGVAASVGMSRSYFSQCYARFAGIPFGESLRGMRLEHARFLLLHTELPVWEISGCSGFEDERYFSRLFRGSTGLLPSEFRQRGGEE